jgi:Domain of unknown function DUF29
MTLYETDWYAWVQEQALLLEQGRFDALDVAHLVEELELMAGSTRTQLYDRLIVLLAHLLKLQVAHRIIPGVYDRNKRGWRLTCAEQRRRLARLLTKYPSLRPTVHDELDEAFAVARLQALAALQIDEAWLPEPCPWPPEQVLDATFWPEDTEEFLNFFQRLPKP